MGLFLLDVLECSRRAHESQGFSGFLRPRYPE